MRADVLRMGAFFATRSAVRAIPYPKLGGISDSQGESPKVREIDDLHFVALKH
jgi:hypothetical protein